MMIDRSDELARYLVVETARQSTRLWQYFAEKALELPDDGDLSEQPVTGCWSVLTPDEISLGFAMAVNVVRGAGFPHEAARLSVLSEVQGHG